MDLNSLLLIFAAHLLFYWATAFAVDLRNTWTFILSAQARAVVVNQMVCTPLVAWIPMLASEPLPWWHAVWQLPAAVMVTDVVFYVVHRAFHRRSLYMKFHCVHHTYNTPIGAAALLAHPVEHILANSLPPLLAGTVTRMDVHAFLFWIVIGTINTVHSHAVPNQHTVHHEKRNKNFGVGLMLMDRLFGTLA